MDKPKIFTSLTIALSLLVGGASYALRAKQSRATSTGISFEALPLSLPGYVGTEERFDSATYAVLKADTTALRRYVDARGLSVWLFVAYFGAQNYGEQIHSPRHCLPGGGWEILSLERIPITLPGQEPWLSNRLLIAADGAEQVMYYFFITRVGTVASEYRLKFDLARAALTLQPRDAAFVRVSAEIENGDVRGADLRCLGLISASLPLLTSSLPF